MLLRHLQQLHRLLQAFATCSDFCSTAQLYKSQKSSFGYVIQCRLSMTQSTYGIAPAIHCRKQLFRQQPANFCKVNSRYRLDGKHGAKSCLGRMPRHGKVSREFSLILLPLMVQLDDGLGPFMFKELLCSWNDQGACSQSVRLRQLCRAG